MSSVVNFSGEPTVTTSVERLRQVEAVAKNERIIKIKINLRIDFLTESGVESGDPVGQFCYMLRFKSERRFELFF